MSKSTDQPWTPWNQELVRKIAETGVAETGGIGSMFWWSSATYPAVNNLEKIEYWSSVNKRCQANNGKLDEEAWNYIRLMYVEWLVCDRDRQEPCEELQPS